MQLSTSEAKLLSSLVSVVSTAVADHLIKLMDRKVSSPDVEVVIPARLAANSDSLLCDLEVVVASTVLHHLR